MIKKLTETMLALGFLMASNYSLAVSIICPAVLPPTLKIYPAGQGESWQANLAHQVPVTSAWITQSSVDNGRLVPQATCDSKRSIITTWDVSYPDNAEGRALRAQNDQYWLVCGYGQDQIVQLGQALPIGLVQCTVENDKRGTRPPRISCH